MASGVPNRNGDLHAEQICAMTLDLLSSVKDVDIPHIPGEKIRLRIGVHSGECVAGLTGIKTPRYLLFGESINTANIIEAEGAPMCVHVSETTARIICTSARFTLKKRGRLQVKGYGPMSTYWLTDLQ